MKSALAVLVLSVSCIEVAPSEVTWSHVQPLLAASCLACHGGERASSLKPALASYEDASAFAQEMLVMVEAGLMPPGGIDRSGACGTFEGPRPFSDDDIALLRAWIDAGTPRGALDVPAVDASPRAVDARELSVEHTLTPANASDADRQRCISVDVQAGALVGVRMEAPAAAHHAMVFTIDDGAVLANAWACDGVPRATSGESGALAFAWVPGSDIVLFPEGAGVRLTSRVIVQVHEHGAVGEGERADLTLLVRDDVDRELAIVPVAIAGFSLAPGGEVTLAREVALPAGDVVGVMPHLHAAGRALSLVVTDADECLVSAPRFDFAFQEVAFFSRPHAITSDARATLTCTWDTRDRAAPTRWGEGSLEEMCTLFLFVHAR